MSWREVLYFSELQPEKIEVGFALQFQQIAPPLPSYMSPHHHSRLPVTQQGHVLAKTVIQLVGDLPKNEQGRPIIDNVR